MALQSMTQVRIEVYVQPRASKTELAGMHGGMVKIRVAAPAVENAANRALVEFLAERIGVPKRRVRVVAGATGRRKILEIDGADAPSIALALGLEVADGDAPSRP